MNASINRRKFVQFGIAAAGVTQVTKARGGSEKQVKIGLIGCGGRGVQNALLLKSLPYVDLVYVCDVDEHHRNAAAKALQVNADHAVSDLRRVLDDKSVDAVVVATPDHWHCPASLLACDAGKHVYVEKPISHNLREGRLLIDLAARKSVLVQHGTQCRSTRMMIDAVKLLHEGVIGNVMAAKCWNIQKRGSIGHLSDSTPPKSLNYEDWVGPATMIPYRANRVHHTWRWWYHFGTGDMGNDGVHELDYARWGLGVQTHPNKIVALGGKYYFDDDQQFFDTQQVTFEYGNDGVPSDRKMLIYEQRLWSTNYPHNSDSGVEFYGTEGQMYLSRRGKMQILDGRNKPKVHHVQLQKHDDVAHLQNFVAAIREGVPLNADASVGHLSTSLCHLGNIATRLGRSLAFDPETEQIIGDEEASLLTRRDYRNHWARPRET